MKRVLVLTVLLWSAITLLVGAEGPDTQYFRIYNLIAEADQIRGAYALGFTPAHEPEGRIHSLRVELKRKGPRVRSTPSYFHAERPEPGVSRTLAALLVGLQEDTLGAWVSIDPQPSDP